MGSIYYMRCGTCGYSFYSQFGFGGFSDGDIIKMTEEQFKEGKADPELQRIYDALKQCTNVEDKKTDQPDNNPKIEVLSALYYCSACNDYFNGNYVIIHGRRGTFTGKCIPCPVCGKRHAIQISEQDMNPVIDDSGMKRKSWLRCPRCNDYMIIKPEGIYD